MDVNLIEIPKPEASESLDEAAAVFLAVRRRLYEIAYRILGSASEAEDLVQDAWLRWQRTDRSVVLNPTAFLATATTRLALNVAQSARSRREIYPMRPLPERADPRSGPDVRAELGDEVEHALFLLLQKLTPVERAAYVLREAFEYPYEQIALILQLSPVNTRQLVRRSHQRIAAERRRPVCPATHRRFVQAFRAASDVGNLAGLERLLAADLAS
jgi:RNA polymerase sigma-70 factor (ECF subfamily)